MNTYTKRFILSLLCGACYCHTKAYNPFQEMRENLQRIEEAFEKNFQQLNSKEGSPTIDLTEQKEGVHITVKNLETSTVDASRGTPDAQDAGDLLIKTDQGSIAIQTQENRIAIECRQKKQKDVHSFYGQESIHAIVSHAIDIQTQHIKLDYNEAEKTLTIYIPFVQPTAREQKRESLPVTMAKKKS